MKRIVSALYEWHYAKRAYAVFVLCSTAIALPAQTFTKLVGFDGADGEHAYAGLVQGTSGDFYGTTWEGGATGTCVPYGCGTVFKITPHGALTTLYSFCSQDFCMDGAYPYGGLVQASNGNFYGTTVSGGAQNAGTIFKITPAGTLSTLYSFCSQNSCADGEGPPAGLTQAANGEFYGTTEGGGIFGGGTIFRITPNGTLTTLYSFPSHSSCTNGYGACAVLVQAINGDFYGTTTFGGANGQGSIFKITPAGTLTTLYSFCSQISCSDGENPYAGLIQATNQNFYGTTEAGGAYGGGTVFRVTQDGTLTTIYSFCSQSGCADGEYPQGPLVEATDGNFYGTTSRGGCAPVGCGTVFELTPGGTLTTLYTFCTRCNLGEAPYAGLLQSTDGEFYGTTVSDEGTRGYGTVFSLSVGLGPFVITQTTSGTVGSVVKILGTNLAGASSVTFNGAAAAFKVLSPSLITATVPVGASDGKVEVVTPSGTLSTNVPFRVL